MTEVATKTFRQWLKKNGACDAALTWVGDKTLEHAWNECTNPFWMQWLIEVSFDDYDWLKWELVAAGFCDKNGDMTLLGNLEKAIEFFRNRFTVEKIKKEIGEEIQ